MELGFFKLSRNVMRHWTRRAPAARSPHYVALCQSAVWSERLQASEIVRCERGVLWLTQINDTSDYFLRAGESFVATHLGRVVVQAMEESLLRVEEARR